jgi:hypothetical protein
MPEMADAQGWRRRWRRQRRSRPTRCFNAAQIGSLARERKSGIVSPLAQDSLRRRALLWGRRPAGKTTKATIGSSA